MVLAEQIIRRRPIREGPRVSELTGDYALWHGDCRDKLRHYPDNYFSGSVTDPPYNLGFMGKTWDSLGSPRLFQKWCEGWGAELLRTLRPGAYAAVFGGRETYHRMVCGLEDAGFRVADCMMWLCGEGFPKGADAGRNGAGEMYQGYRSELKPGWEPIALLQKPIQAETIARNLSLWGCGALNIDECRIGTEERYNRSAGNTPGTYSLRMGQEGMPQDAEGRHTIGRFPANVFLDELAAGILDGQNGDSGGASRFFYQAKAKSRDRGLGNNHPTVKPIRLIRYIHRLIVPIGGATVDPFAGSGRHLIAGICEGSPVVGIEQDAANFAIIERHVPDWSKYYDWSDPFGG